MTMRLAATLLVLASGCGCILRPGMNPGCAWPTEVSRPLDLTNAADLRHLVEDAELIEELVDRYRFHSVDDQQHCESRLMEIVAETHRVGLEGLARARQHIPERGLNLAVIVPVVSLFLVSVVAILGRIERRFSGEPLPMAMSLLLVSIVVALLFMWFGEFWTSVLQMIRVGSQHVGGRVRRLPWIQHQKEIFAMGITLFWTVAALRWAGRRVGISKAADA